MAREKNPPGKAGGGKGGQADTPAGQPSADYRPGDGPFPEQVRVSKVFKKRIQRVALDLDIDMGALVEIQLNDYLTREEDRIFLEESRRRGRA